MCCCLAATIAGKALIRQFPYLYAYIVNTGQWGAAHDMSHNNASAAVRRKI